mmetsp:Transcript_34267/g.81741  ORF Transcript_34267/g.81741 Transcript_34267/m.81741 type:complete len:212 (+) Transcript_34267:625-1260(+)
MALAPLLQVHRLHPHLKVLDPLLPLCRKPVLQQNLPQIRHKMLLAAVLHRQHHQRVHQLASHLRKPLPPSMVPRCLLRRLRHRARCLPHDPADQRLRRNVRTQLVHEPLHVHQPRRRHLQHQHRVVPRMLRTARAVRAQLELHHRPRRVPQPQLLLEQRVRPTQVLHHEVAELPGRLRPVCPELVLASQRTHFQLRDPITISHQDRAKQLD